MGVKKKERETIIVFNEADNAASVYTFNTDPNKTLEGKSGLQCSRLTEKWTDSS